MEREHRQNIQRFQDTLNKIKQDPILSHQLKDSIDGSQLYHTAPSVPTLDKPRSGAIIVSKKRTFSAAQDYLKKNPQKSVAVLNFASPLLPAAGLNCAYNTQEEVLCRCSTLYPALDCEPFLTQYYKKHRKADNPLFTDDCIFTPDVTVFKDDRQEQLMPQADWFQCHVLTSAAPCLYDVKEKPVRISKGKYDKLLENRCHTLLAVAVHHGVEMVVLGAFGCGAFGNDPEQVAKAFDRALVDYRAYFDMVEFAVPAPNEKNSGNYKAFEIVFGA